LKHKFWDKLVHSRELLIPWGLGWLLALIATWIFVDLAGDVWLMEGFTWDAPVMLAIHRLTTPRLTALMLVVTTTGQSIAVVVLAVVLYWLWRHDRRLDAVTTLVSFVGAVAISTVLKLVFARPRPHVFPPLVPPINTYSFPSGHTLASVALYGLLAIWLWRGGHRWWAVLSAAWVLVVGFSRIYLGAHYPSDVVASLALGTVWLVLIMAGYDRLARRWSEEAEEPDDSEEDEEVM
jgi:membrane-associated phospholipid phosphatase